MQLGGGKIPQGSEMHVPWEEDHLDGDLCLSSDTVVVTAAVPRELHPWCFARCGWLVAGDGCLVSQLCWSSHLGAEGEL